MDNFTLFTYNLPTLPTHQAMFLKVSLKNGYFKELQPISICIVSLVDSVIVIVKLWRITPKSFQLFPIYHNSRFIQFVQLCVNWLQLFQLHYNITHMSMIFLYFINEAHFRIKLYKVYSPYFLQVPTSTRLMVCCGPDYYYNLQQYYIFKLLPRE